MLETCGGVKATVLEEKGELDDVFCAMLYRCVLLSYEEFHVIVFHLDFISIFIF